MTKLFYESRRFGFYLRVLRKGVLQAGDDVTVVARDPNAVRVADAIRLFTGESRDSALLERALKVSTLSSRLAPGVARTGQGRRAPQS